jgi:hypothetical protein
MEGLRCVAFVLLPSTGSPLPPPRMRCRQSGCDVDFLLKDLKEHEEEVHLLLPSLPLLARTLSYLFPARPSPDLSSWY